MSTFNAGIFARMTTEKLLAKVTARALRSNADTAAGRTYSKAEALRRTNRFHQKK